MWNERRAWAMLGAGLLLAAGCGKKPAEQGGSSSSSSSGSGALGGGVLAQVAEAKLTESDLQRLIPEELRDGITGPEVRDILDRWVRSELLYQKALKDGLENEAPVTARLQELRRDLLADELLQRELANRVRVTNEELQAYYRKHQNEYTEELQLKHVVVNTREEAEEVLALVRTGTPIEDLARQRSRDATASRGGDLGFLGKGAMNPAFESAVFSLEPGQVAGPIATTFGFHVIKVAAKRPAAEPLSFDAVRDEIMHTLLLEKQQAAQQQLLDELRRGTAVQMATAYAGMPLVKAAQSDEPRDAPGRAPSFAAPQAADEAQDSLATVRE